MKINLAYNLLFGFSLMLMLSSCGSSSGDKERNSEDFRAAEQDLKEQIEEVVYNIPSPSEIPALLQQTGAEFNAALLNDKSKVDQYITRSESAAINLGIYVTDIGYLTAYDKTQEAIDYMNVCKTLADNLDILGAFDSDLLKKFEANLSDKDSLARLLDSTVKRTEIFLKNGDRNKLAALVITGSFVEGLYISTGLVSSYPKDILPDDVRNQVLTPLIRVILEQEKSVDELVRMVESVDQTGLLATLLPDLKALQQTYEVLDIEEQITNNRGDLVLTDQNLVQIGVIVERMRKNIAG